MEAGGCTRWSPEPLSLQNLWSFEIMCSPFLSWSGLSVSRLLLLMLIYLMAERRREGGGIPFLFSHSCAPWRHICSYWRAKPARVPVPSNISSCFHVGGQPVVPEGWQSSNGSKRRERQRELRGSEWSGTFSTFFCLPFPHHIHSTPYKDISRDLEV